MHYGNHFNLCESYLSPFAVFPLTAYLFSVSPWDEIACLCQDGDCCWLKISSIANRPAQHLPKINSANDESKNKPVLICVICGARSGEGVQTSPCLRVPVIQLLYVPWAVPACLSASPGERVTPLHLILLSAALLLAGQIQYIQIVPREKC